MFSFVIQRIILQAINEWLVRDNSDSEWVL